jgi:hypothetical protein
VILPKPGRKSERRWGHRRRIRRRAHGLVASLLHTAELLAGCHVPGLKGGGRSSEQWNVAVGTTST